MHAHQLQLNRIAQGVLSEAAGNSWFEELSSVEQTEVLQDLAYVCHQAHPKPSEVPEAITRSGLKPTFTPCVMLKSVAIPEHAISRIISLPAEEHAKAFRLLLALFAIADTRRRETQCKGGCTHEWHNLATL